MSPNSRTCSKNSPAAVGAMLICARLRVRIFCACWMRRTRLRDWLALQPMRRAAHAEARRWHSKVRLTIESFEAINPIESKLIVHMLHVVQRTPEFRKGHERTTRGTRSSPCSPPASLTPGSPPTPHCVVGSPSDLRCSRRCVWRSRMILTPTSRSSAHTGDPIRKIARPPIHTTICSTSTRE